MMKYQLKKKKKSLKNEEIIVDSDIVRIKNNIKEEIEESFEYAKESLLPRSDALFDHIYA